MLRKFRQNLAVRLYGADIVQAERQVMVEAVKSAASLGVEVWEPSPQFMLEAVKAALREMDATEYTDMLALIDPGWALGFQPGLEPERISTVARSRQAWRNDPVTQWVITTWTNFAFGENVQMKVLGEGNEEAGKIIDEFWLADRNHYVLAQDRLQKLSDQVLVDGELFMTLYISTLDGKATIRIIPTDEILDIVTLKQDSTVPVYYKRQYLDASDAAGMRTVYYMDWLTAIETEGKGRPELLPKDAVQAEQAAPSTFVCMVHVAMNTKTSKRGWPLMTAGLPWSREHKRFREHRSAVAAAVATYVNKIKTSGGQRAVDIIRDRLQSSMVNSGVVDRNPPATAGSNWIENQALSLERLPLNTAAQDAKTDGEALLLMAGLGGGLFPHWLGAGDAYRLATATAMEAPLMREFSRYQNYWAAQFRSVARVVLWASNTWGEGTDIEYEGLMVDVSTDRLVEVDLVAISGAIRDLYNSTLNPLVEAGVINPEVVQEITAFVWMNALQALGAPQATSIGDPKKFKPVPRPSPAPANAPTTEETPETPEEPAAPSEIRDLSGMPGNGKRGRVAKK